MSVSVAYDIWSELKLFMSVSDRSDAADTLIAVLIDNDYDADEIKVAFKNDPDVQNALHSYIDDAEDEIEYDDQQDDDD